MIRRIDVKEKPPAHSSLGGRYGSVYHLFKTLFTGRNKLSKDRGEFAGKKRELHIFIFSKDRACQLDSLLRSVHDNLSVPVKQVTVLYRATDINFRNSYKKLKTANIIPGIEWVEESDFREDLVGMIDRLADNSLVMFLVDDNIFFRPFNDNALLRKFADRHLFISLRCSRTYAKDVSPSFLHETKYLEWKWNYHKKRPVTWNYPLGVDGNIFHARVLKRILHHISFRAPNSLEGNMHTYRHAWWVKRIRLALAPLAAVVVNNPLNRVQTEGKTWHQDISPAQLNQKYLEGYRINNSNLYSAEPTAIHFAMDVQFERDF